MRKYNFNTLKDEPLEAEVNLTPLIDVVFVVLIMFMVVAPLLELNRVQLAPGNPNSPDKSTIMHEQNPINIYVRKDNSLWINEKNYTLGQFREIMKKEYLKHPTSIPRLFHDKKAEFGTYQNVKNAVEIAGFKELDLILDPS
jgi:biopolymer transport protein ExbD